MDPEENLSKNGPFGSGKAAKISKCFKIDIEKSVVDLSKYEQN